MGSFNGDGFVDLAVANFNANTVTILLDNCALADLGASVSDSPDPVPADTDLTYTITAQNLGPVASSDVTLTDPLPANTTLASFIAPPGWSCTTPAVGTNGTVACSIASFPVGSASFTLVAHVDPTAAGSTLHNVVSIDSATTPDEPGTNNSASTDTTVAAASTLSITDATVTEGNSGATNAVFTVTLSPASTQTVTVVAQTADGTATAGSDYTAIGPTTLTFTPGQTSQTLSVPILGDTAVEPDETFIVNLTGPTHAVLGKAQGTGTIQNDDGGGNAVAIVIDDATVTEGNSGTSSATFTVVLTRVSTSTVTVQFNTQDGTATTADNDYQAASGTLTFNPGELTKTLTVTVMGDTKVEPTEAFTVGLASPTNATIARAAGIGMIVTDDTAAATACSPRPDVGVTTQATGDGRLQVTVTAGTQGPNGANHLSELRFGAGTNALIDVAGQSGRTGPFTVALTGSPTSVTFFVRRATPGQTTTVPVTIVDSCGEWPTFVGGGPGAF